MADFTDYPLDVDHCLHGEPPPGLDGSPWSWRLLLRPVCALLRHRLDVTRLRCGRCHLHLGDERY